MNDRFDRERIGRKLGGGLGGGGGVLLSTTSTSLAGAGITITSPRGGQIVDEDFRVQGIAFVRMQFSMFIKAGGQGHHEIRQFFVTDGFKVNVRVGDDEREARVSVRNGRLHWFLRVRNASAGRLLITATLDGKVEETSTKEQGGQTQHHSETRVVRRDDSVAVTVDADLPRLSIHSRSIPTSPPWEARFEGTARDKVDIERVHWARFSSGADASGDAENLSGTWSRWRAVIPLGDRDTDHRIEIIATDEVGHETAESITIFGSESPPEVEITDPLSPHTEFLQGDSVTVDVSGTTSHHIDVTEVEWRLDDGEFQPATPVADDWSLWRTTVTLDRSGTRRVGVRARDSAGRMSEPEILIVEVKELVPVNG